MTSRRDADARHPAASAQLNGVVDALLVDVEIVRDRVNGDALSGGRDLPECRQSRRVARRTAQFEAVGMVDDHPFGIEQRGVSAAGRTLRHAGIDFGQRKINAAYMPAARAVRHRAGHAPDLNPSRTGHMAAHRVAVRCGDEPAAGNLRLPPWCGAFFRAGSCGSCGPRLQRTRRTRLWGPSASASPRARAVRRPSARCARA